MATDISFVTNYKSINMKLKSKKIRVGELCLLPSIISIFQRIFKKLKNDSSTFKKYVQTELDSHTKSFKGI